MVRRALVIGGGVAGPVAAIALRGIGFEVAIAEARTERMEEAGSWFSLGPNGLNALADLGLADAVLAHAFPVPGLVFANAAGTILGAIEGGDEVERYGAEGVVLKRGPLHVALREAATARGIPYETGKRLEEITLRDGVAVTRFADGSEAEADLVVGADGIRSATRRFVAPDASGPTFTGIVGYSGFARPAGPPSVGEMRMTFGRRAFVGYAPAPDGEVYWYDNVHWSQDLPQDEDAGGDPTALRRWLTTLHADDPAPIPDLAATTPGPIRRWDIHDLPPLPCWHRGPVCLVGDAAHAAAPHGAQGASLAIEDAVVLARCLRDEPTVDDAFAAYQRERKPRVDGLYRQARSRGRQMLPRGPLAAWLRDRILPWALRQADVGDDWLYDYRTGWSTDGVGKSASRQVGKETS
jgi:2-polyprenyl-6-methoxyphenol hydroxylase-like FAD-dependent oxidoreductase